MYVRFPIYVCMLLLAIICAIISITSIVETLLIENIENKQNLLLLLYILYVLFAFASCTFSAFALIFQKEYFERLRIVSIESHDAAIEVLNEF